MVDSPLMLIGFMGAGKTTVGRMLADQLKIPFVDLDKRIEMTQQRSIPDIFRDNGEPFFREIEYQCLDDILNCNSGAAIISVGGGIIEFEKSRNCIQRLNRVVWLKIRLDTVETRLSQKGVQERPLFDAQVQPRFERRQSLYESCADFSVQVDDLLIEEVAEKIINRYG